MLVSAVLLVAASQQRGPVQFHKVMTTEARSPQSPHATIIRDKRHAFDFFYLIKPGAPKPISIKKINWRKTNVLVIYPGLVQTDARITLLGVKRQGSLVKAAIKVQRGITAETHYPMTILTVPKLPASSQAQLDQLRAVSKYRLGHRSA